MAGPDEDPRGANATALDAAPGDGAPLFARSQRWAQAAGLLVATAGAVVFVGGWCLGSPTLRSLAPAWPPMRVNTSIMCLLGGLSLALLGGTPLSRGGRLGGLVAAAAVGLLAGLTLLEHAPGWDLGIDPLVLRGATGLAQPFDPRVPPPVAVAFLLLSGALALLAARGPRGRRLLDVLALAGFAIGAAAVMSFLHKVPALYQLPPRGPLWGMSLPAALALVALAGGVLCARPASGLMSIIASPEAGGYMARRLIVIVVLGFPAIALVAEAGWWAGFYSDQAASAIVLLSGIAAGSLGVLITGKRLNEASADLRSALRDAFQWKHFFRRASWGVLIAAPDGRLMCVNQAYARMRGGAPEELAGTALAELFAPAEQPLLAERLRLCAERGQQTFDSSLARKDGSTFQVVVDTTAVSDERGRILHFALHVRDHTEHEEIRRKLRAADEATHRLLRQLDAATRAHLAISDAVLSLPERGRRHLLEVILNKAQELTSARYGAIGFGMDPERPFDPWVEAGIPPEQEAAIGRAPRPVGTLGAAARGDIVRLRDVRAHPDFLGWPPHHPEMSSFLGVPILDRGKNVGTIYLADKRDAEEFTAEDQTLVEMLAARASAALETARLFEAETRQRLWLETALEQVPEAILLVDAQGKLFLENGASRALGHAEGPPDARGEPTPQDLRFPDGTPVPATEFPLHRALAHGEEVRDLELVVRRPDGEMIPILVSAVPVRVEGQVVGAVAARRDIRALKELERLREEWSALVAHDLRQPASVIALTADRFLSMHAGGLSDQDRKALERLKKAAGDLQRMIGDLLDASLIETRHLEITPAAMSLDGVVSEVLATMPELSGHPVRHQPRGRDRVWADRARVEQILRNLLSNAVKYGEPGGEIGVDVEARDGSVETAVTNHGRGIEPAEIAGLFQRFKRSGPSRASGAPGIGLGLYVTKGLVEAQGGRIWIESTPGRVTIVRFTLPTPVASAA